MPHVDVTPPRPASPLLRLRRGPLRLTVLGAALALGTACTDAMDDVGLPVDPPPAEQPEQPEQPGQPEQPAQPAVYGYYTRYDSGADWEQHQFVGQYPDIVVSVGDVGQVRFWRGSSYLPSWNVGATTTYVDHVFETNGDGEGLRFDKLNRHSHVRIISQSADAVVVHWRYAPEFDTGAAPMLPGWTGWIDEYYTIGADGRMTREVLDHTDGETLTFAIDLAADGTLTQTAVDRGDLALGPPAISPADRLPTGPDAGFGARYQRLGYSGAWDLGPDDDYAPISANWNDNWQVGEHPDVVVDFDGNTTKWVFWRGLSFVPSMVSENGAWFSNEFNESWGWPEMCEEGGAEPMNDKQARYSHVRIIENTPARVVVHWRYHPTGVCYNLIDTSGTPDGWGAASDFVFYIYPDGSTLSQNTLFSQQVNTWFGGPNGFEYHEAMIMHGPGAMPSDNIDVSDTVTVMNLDGGRWVFDGAEGGINDMAQGEIIDGEPAPFVEGEPVNITRVNLRDTAFDTYTIMPDSDDNVIQPYLEYDLPGSSPDGHFVSWDHWPVNQIRAFGRGSEDNRYPSHTSLFHMYNGPASGMGDHWQQRLFLTGLSDRDDAFVAALARAWLRPPAVQAAAGVAEARYDQTERAYQLAARGPRLDFTLAGSTESPVVNPAFVVRGWGSAEAEVRVDGQRLDAVKQGIGRDADGAPMLLLFVPVEAEAATRIEVCRGGC